MPAARSQGERHRGQLKGEPRKPAFRRGRDGGGPPPLGFTLLEAVVALAIFSAGAMALYSLFTTNLISLTRAHDTMDRTPYVEYAIDYLSAINPRLQPEGQVDLGGFEVAWSATLIEPPRQSQNAVGFLGNFELGLYDVAFEVTVTDSPATAPALGTSLGAHRLRLVGYEKVRGLVTEFEG